MIVPDPNMFGGSVYTCKKLGGKWTEYKTGKMPLGKINIRTKSLRANESPVNANYRGAGLAEMAYSIENKKIHKCNGELSVHVLDIIQSIFFKFAGINWFSYVLHASLFNFIISNHRLAVF